MKEAATAVKWSREAADPSWGVLMMPAWMAKRGATFRLGVEADPTRGVRCSSSPKMHPTDHMSIADEYLPLAITTSGAL